MEFPGPGEDLFEVIQKGKRWQMLIEKSQFTEIFDGESYNKPELDTDPKKEITYIVKTAKNGSLYFYE